MVGPVGGVMPSAWTAFWKSSVMGFMWGEWKAWLTVRGRVLWPRVWKRWVRWWTALVSPEMTVEVGVLIAAMATPVRCSSVMVWVIWCSVAVMAVMAPPGGRVCMRVARVVTRAAAWGSVRMPAVWAAVMAPMECPATAVGVMPQEAASSTRAIWRANSPVWV